MVRVRGFVIAAVGAAVVTSACTREAAFSRLLQARALASELHLEFTRAAEAANRAVMAETDDTATSAAAEARRARENVERGMKDLRPVMQSLGYSEDLRHLEAFEARFEEYARLDDEILSLAVENTNLKAQRLSFGPARDAADAFAASLAAVAGASPANDACIVEVQAERARAAVFDILARQASHIAESDDDVMTRMEGQMKTEADVAHEALDQASRRLPHAGPRMAEAAGALNRFMAIHAEVVKLSRRNSDVRSLALSLGRKRALTEACENELQGLDHALAKHAPTATR